MNLKHYEVKAVCASKFSDAVAQIDIHVLATSKNDAICRVARSYICRDILAVKDVTIDYPISCADLDSALYRYGFGQAEIDIILQLVEENLPTINKF